MVIDLGLDRRPTPSERQKMAVNFNWNTSNSPSVETTNTEFWSVEARRAYIGCYIISSSYIRLNRKMPSQKYSSYLEDCAVSVSKETGMLSDSVLIPMVHLAHLTEQASDALGYDEIESPLPMTDERLAFTVKNFAMRIAIVRDELPYIGPSCKTTLLDSF
jgi:hypothetical protein